jgi:hypothetical protein
VLRGFIVAFVVCGATGDGTLDSFPLPSLFGSWLLGLALLVAAIAGSVALGNRTMARWRWWLVPLNAAVVFAGLVAAGRVHDAMNRVTYPLVAPPPPYLNDSGRPIYNIYPYDVSGKPLAHVLLYDDSGGALGNLAPEAGQAPFPLNRYGESILNEFPRIALVPTKMPDGQIRLAPVGRPKVSIPKRPEPSAKAKRRHR